MEFVETVKVMEPESGRLCSVFFTADEVSKLLSIATSTLLMHGVLRLKEQSTDMYVIQDTDSENPPVGH